MNAFLTLIIIFGFILLVSPLVWVLTNILYRPVMDMLQGKDARRIGHNIKVDRRVYKR